MESSSFHARMPIERVMGIWFPVMVIALVQVAAGWTRRRTGRAVGLHPHD
jgi:hypothetical protein